MLSLVTMATLASSAQPPNLGSIDFPTSGSPTAHAHFIRGVSWLHSFGYEEAIEAFREAQKIDPGFAMAYWGEAMSRNQPLWHTQDLEAGRSALARLGSTRAARIAKAPTAREKGFLEAVDELFGAGDKQARDLAYARAMARLAARFPADHEASVFHALALLGTAPRAAAAMGEGDEAHQTQQAHQAHQTHQGLAGSETQAGAASILQKVRKENPDHPGAAHYLIHAYDDPAHAELALPAARAYAKIAPASSHALHMPAHVFLQLGMWDEAAASDEASFAASEERVRRRRLSIAERDYHSLAWLQYEYLQQGRYTKARETLSLVRPAVEESRAPRLRNTLASMRARYVIETRRWQELAGEQNYFNPDELFAMGMAAAKRGDLAMAATARDRLRAIAESDKIRELKPIVAIMERQVAALVELGSLRGAGAIRSMAQAAALEDRLPPPVGRPHPLKPSRELLGEILLEAGRPREAAAQFELALGRSANRALAVLGLARASQKLGDATAARRHYGKLQQIWHKADPDLPELQEIKQFVSRAR